MSDPLPVLAHVGEIPAPVYPERVSFGGQELSIGHKGYALLKAVIDGGGSATLADLALAVYGQQEVRRNRIEVQCCRVNRRLAELGCVLRLGVDDGRVVLT